MALTKSFTTPQGFTASNAYARILTFSGNKDFLAVVIEVHKDLQARLDALAPITMFNISLPLAEGATMEQMYTALKLDGNFTDAVDC